MSQNLIIFNAKVVTPLGFSAWKGKEMAELRILEKVRVEVVDGDHDRCWSNRGKCVMGYYHHFLALQCSWEVSLAGFCRFTYPFRIWGRAGRRIFVAAPQRGELYVYHAAWRRYSPAQYRLPVNSHSFHLRSEGRRTPQEDDSHGNYDRSEGKSGYGLNRETELLQLEVMRSLKMRVYGWILCLLSWVHMRCLTNIKSVLMIILTS